MSKSRREDMNSGVSVALSRPVPRADLIRLALLAILTALIWCTVYNRWTAESWQTPVDYLSDPEKGDVISLFAAIKAASEGHILPFFFIQVPELGAPHVASWDDYPTTEKPLIILTGWLARGVGVFAAVNFTLLMASVLAAVAFYAAARLLDYEWIWSFAGALIFAFARYAFAQGEHHITVTYYWHVPLCLVVAYWLIRGEGITFKSWKFRLAVVVAVVTGVQNIYYTNMFVQLVLIGGLQQICRNGWKAALPAISIVAASAVAFLLMNMNTFAYSLTYGGNNNAVVRNYHWLEIYGLKLVDMVMPPPDHPVLGGWGAAHIKEILLSPGESPPSAYLGLVGLAAVAWLAVESWRRLVNRVGVPVEAWLMLWIILYAEVGGLNGIVGTLGFQLFRATTRYSIFISCIALMFAASRLSLMKLRNSLLIYGAVFLAVVLAMWDQTPPFVTDNDLKATAQQVASDRKFAEKMEQQLPAGGMVFQIPVMDFPESPAPNVGSYDHFRPYLYTNHLRYSFGSDKGRPQDEWQHTLAQTSFGDAITKLESYGFSAIYINLNGFQDKGQAAVKALKDSGRTEMFMSDEGDLLCVLLKPSPQPVMPDNY